MPAKKSSAFLKWFVAQHGRRETDMREMDDRSLYASTQVGIAAAKELARRLEWDARKESALYAWNARKS